MLNIFKKEECRHMFTIEKTMWSEEFREALYATGRPVTSFEYVEEQSDGSKPILYDITIIGDNETWDALNRTMGKLGITTFKRNKKATTKVK